MDRPSTACRLLSSDNPGDRLAEEARRLLVVSAMTDMAVCAVEGRTMYTIRCHRIVIASSSHFLRTLIEDESPSEDKALLVLDGVSGRQLECLVSFLYSGSLVLETAAERRDMIGLLDSLQVRAPVAGPEETAQQPKPLKPPEAEATPVAASSSSVESIEVQDLMFLCCPNEEMTAAATATEADLSLGTLLLRLPPPSSCSDHNAHKNADVNAAESQSNLLLSSSSAAAASTWTHESCCRRAEHGERGEARTDLFVQVNAEHVQSSFSAVDKAPPAAAALGSGGKEREQQMVVSLQTDNGSLMQNAAQSPSSHELDLIFNERIRQHRSSDGESGSESSGASSPGSAGEGPARRQHQCAVCSKRFSSQYYLRFHEKSVHNTGSRDHSCSECAKRFTSAYYLRQHVARMHSAVKKFHCPHCPTSFGVRYDLVIHLRTHKAVKDFVCDHPGCDRRYATHRAAVEHRRTHTGERPFECDRCGRRFALPKTLRVHYRQHSGERPYLCPVCGATFVQNATLRSHLRSRHQAVTVA